MPRKKRHPLREAERAIEAAAKEAESDLESRLLAAEEVATATSSAEVNLASAIVEAITDPFRPSRKAKPAPAPSRKAKRAPASSRKAKAKAAPPTGSGKAAATRKARRPPRSR